MSNAASKQHAQQQAASIVPEIFSRRSLGRDEAAVSLRRYKSTKLISSILWVAIATVSVVFVGVMSLIAFGNDRGEPEHVSVRTKFYQPE